MDHFELVSEYKPTGDQPQAINELANMMDIPVTQVISTCMSVGIMVSINQRLDAETTFVNSFPRSNRLASFPNTETMRCALWLLVTSTASFHM